MKITLVFGVVALMMMETVSADDDTCDLSEIEDCVTGFLRYFLDQFVNFHTVPEELEVTCLEIKKNATCATSQPNHCKDRYPKLKNLLNAIEKYSDRFCRNSEEQKLYLDQAPCLDQHKELFQECIEPNPKETIGSQTITFGCKSLENVIACINDTGNKCGKPAKMLMEYLIEPLDVYPVHTSSLKRSWMKIFDCVTTDDVDVDDSTVVCVFQNVKKCYKAIAKLGADLTVELPKTYQELHRICHGKMVDDFNDCMNEMVWTCNSDIGNAFNIRNNIAGFCRNGSVYQKAFMDSTECYNSHVPETRKCYNRYAADKSDNAKALCNSAYEIKQCTNFMTNQCSKNVTIIPGRDYTDVLPAVNLAHKYYEYSDAVCQKYYKQYTKSSSFEILPANTWMSMAVSILITLFKMYEYKL